MNQLIRTIPVVVFILAIILVSIGAVKDGDLWWQMEYGRQLLANGTLITDHTIYSWTASTNEFIYCAWIAQIGLYLIYEAYGLMGLNFLRASILLLPGFLVWLLYRQHKVEMPAFMWGVSFVAVYSAKHSAGLLKPELFGFMFFTLLVFAFFMAKASNNAKLPIALIPLIILLWINSHGTFAVGGFFLVMALVGELINRKFKPELGFSSGQWRLIYIIVPVVLLVTVITPYGIAYPLQLISWYADSGSDPSYGQVSAYNSIFSEGLKHLGAVYFFGILGAFYIALLWETIKLKRFDFSILLLNIVFLAFSSGWGRASYFSPIVLLMSIAFLVMHSPFCKSLEKNGRFAKTIGVLSTLAVLVFSTSWFYSSRTADPRGPLLGVGFLNPQEEARYLQNNHLGAKICNGYNGGGYLLWLFKDTQRVMIDPRYFPYKSWYSEWLELVKTPSKVNFAKYQCDLWVLNHNYDDMNNALIKDSKWTLSFIGPAAAVYVKSELTKANVEVEVSSKVGALRSLPRTALILNNLLAIKDFDTAETIATNAREFWLETANEMRSLRALEFVQGTRNFYQKNDVRAYSLLFNAHGGAAVITNYKRLMLSGQFAVESLWKQGRYELAHDIAMQLLDRDPDDLINLYSGSLLTLLANRHDSFNWKDGLTKFLKTAKPEDGIPENYYEYAEQMLASSKASNAPPLKPMDSRSINHN